MKVPPNLEAAELRWRTCVAVRAKPGVARLLQFDLKPLPKLGTIGYNRQRQLVFLKRISITEEFLYNRQTQLVFRWEFQ